MTPNERETNRLWDEQNTDEPEVKEEHIPDLDPEIDHYLSDLAARDYESRIFQDPKQ